LTPTSRRLDANLSEIESIEAGDLMNAAGDLTIKARDLMNSAVSAGRRPGRLHAAGRWRTTYPHRAGGPRRPGVRLMMKRPSRVRVDLALSATALAGARARNCRRGLTTGVLGTVSPRFWSPAGSPAGWPAR
jgi:hypothetical protein